MQDMTNHWRGPLHVTGGDLNLYKCNWTRIGFYWDEDGQWHYQTNIISTIQIPDLAGIMQILEKLGPSQATTLVGVVQVADDNMTGQLLVLKEAAKDVAEMIIKGYLPQWLVWQTLQTLATLW
jgi:hypothetical protein